MHGSTLVWKEKGREKSWPRDSILRNARLPFLLSPHPYRSHTVQHSKVSKVLRMNLFSDDVM